jgi:hypothetical protein
MLDFSSHSLLFCIERVIALHEAQADMAAQRVPDFVILKKHKFKNA